MRTNNLEQAIIDIGKVLADEGETMDSFDNQTLQRLAACLLLEVDARDTRVLN